MSVLDDGRRMAESRMTDSCTISRVTRGALNESTGKHTETTTQVYSGPCRVKPASVAARNVESGSALVALSVLELHLPISAVGVRADDAVSVTGSVTRGEQVGRRFTVVAPFDGSQTTALRFRIEAADERRV